MPNLGGGKARYNLRDVPKVNSLFLNLNIYTCTHVHISEIKIGGGGVRKQSVRIIGDSKIANAHD